MQFYTALNQMVARICHQNAEVSKYLVHIIVKVVSSYPQQGLWPLLAMHKSTKADRASWANRCINGIKVSVDMYREAEKRRKSSCCSLHSLVASLDSQSTVSSRSLRRL